MPNEEFGTYKFNEIHVPVVAGFLTAMLFQNEIKHFINSKVPKFIV